MKSDQRTLLPELAKIVCEYSKPWMPYWREYKQYCQTEHYGEWPELQEMLKLGDQDTIDALLGYFTETEPEQGTFGIVLYRKTWWKHELAKAVYGEDVVWWEFADYPVWLWAQIILDQGAGICILHQDLDSPYQEEFDQPIEREVAPEWVNQYDETHEDFTGYYELGQSRL
jgi:hypothetical protein